MLFTLRQKFIKRSNFRYVSSCVHRYLSKVITRVVMEKKGTYLYCIAQLIIIFNSVRETLPDGLGTVNQYFTASGCTGYFLTLWSVRQVFWMRDECFPIRKWKINSFLFVSWQQWLQMRDSSIKTMKSAGLIWRTIVFIST